MLENLQKYEVILASNSPRRRELLTNLGVTFTPFVIFGIDESYPPELKGEDVALYVAKKKAAAYKESTDHYGRYDRFYVRKGPGKTQG